MFGLELMKLSFTVNVERWERVISEEEDILEKCKQNEEKQRAAIDEDKAKIEQLKSEKQEKKKSLDNMEKDTNKARHDVSTSAKAICNHNYQISSIDTKIETKKNERHNILIQSKVRFAAFPRRSLTKLATKIVCRWTTS